MTLRVILFLIGQIILLAGGFQAIKLLRAHRLLVTPWGLAVVTWYLYLLIWYGPSSVFVVLGEAYVKEVATHPWWLREDMLVPSLINAMVLQLMPCLVNLIVLKTTRKHHLIVWSRLEPLLGHVTNLWFGIFGTVAQLSIATIYGQSWLQSRFDFAALPPLAKAAASGFFILTIGPQLSLLAFRYWQKIKMPYIDWILLPSIFAALYSFSRFGQRTYAMFEIVLLIYVFWLVAPAARKILVLFLPISILSVYSLVSLQARVKSDTSPVKTASTILQRLVDDVSYRSHIANDSVILGARSCVRNQLRLEGVSPSALLSMELASGLPAPMRSALYPELSDQRLESRVGRCYRKWLGEPSLRPDLSDSKTEYFLVSFNPLFSALLGSVSWLFLSTFFLSSISYLYYLGARYTGFFVPASAHLLVLSTTPGEFLVFFKAVAPYLALFILLGVLIRRVQRLRFV